MPVLRYFIPLAVLLCFLPLALLRAQTNGLQLQEQEIKVGLLYNFLKYTEWPESSFTGNSIVVCIFGNDPFNGKLRTMAGRTVNQRTIVVRQANNVREAADCHLLFVSESEKQRWPALREALTGKNILTVSDFSSFAAEGGMIEFGYKNDHISASLNNNALTNAGLRVEDRLLRLVTLVRGG